MFKRFLFTIILLLTLSACSPVISTTPAATPSSGIEGQVTEGPMCPGPVPVGENTCPDQPYQASIDVLGTDNKLITQFQTDTQGNFKISLPPGTYLLHPISGKPLPHAADQTVVVNVGEYTSISILYDTGMR